MATLVIEDSVINGLAGNAAILSAFPILNNAMQQRATSGCCGNKKTTIDYPAVKRAFVGLDPVSRETFKKMMNVDKVTVLYRIGGSLQTISF